MLCPRAMLMAHQRKDVKSKPSRAPINDTKYEQDLDQMDHHLSEETHGQAVRPITVLRRRYCLQTPLSLGFSHPLNSSSPFQPVISHLYQPNPLSHSTNPPITRFEGPGSVHIRCLYPQRREGKSLKGRSEDWMQLKTMNFTTSE